MFGKQEYFYRPGLKGHSFCISSKNIEQLVFSFISNNLLTVFVSDLSNILLYSIHGIKPNKTKKLQQIRQNFTDYESLSTNLPL